MEEALPRRPTKPMSSRSPTCCMARKKNMFGALGYRGAQARLDRDDLR
jgi:hypothetical protein